MFPCLSRQLAAGSHGLVHHQIPFGSVSLAHNVPEFPLNWHSASKRFQIPDLGKHLLINN